MGDGRYLLLDSTSTTIRLCRRAGGAVIIYGRGADLGDFSVFANSLRSQLKATYGEDIVVQRIYQKAQFFEFLSSQSFTFKIRELHIFCHAFGTGLALGYGDPAMAQERRLFAENDMAAYYSRGELDLLYDAIIAREKGILFVDDLLDCPTAKRDAIRAAFVRPGATVKVWGCNAAVEAWYYDPSDLYWGALNRKRVPKPSIAKTLATFAQVVTYGARSGSHIEVLDGNSWITTEEYKAKYGSYPARGLQYRLEPDQGGYIAHNP